MISMVDAFIYIFQSTATSLQHNIFGRLEVQAAHELRIKHRIIMLPIRQGILSAQIMKWLDPSNAISAQSDLASKYIFGALWP